MCIYYHGREGLTYGSEEHVISAGLGGIAKLPIEYVSKEFNNEMSNFERDLMKLSPISLPRQIWGPGKRGSLADSKQSKSEIHVMIDKDEFKRPSLGYVQQGRPKQLTHIVLDLATGAVSIGLQKTEHGNIKTHLHELADHLDHVKELHVKVIRDKNLSEKKLILGCEVGKEKGRVLYLAVSETSEISIDSIPLSALSAQLRHINGPHDNYNGHVQSHQGITISHNHFRVMAKMCMNFLAYWQGDSIVRSQNFADTRDWIANGKAIPELVLLKDEDLQHLKETFPTPLDAHLVVVTQKDSEVFGYCILYGMYGIQIKLGTGIAVPMGKDGLICDWRNHKEYRLSEWPESNRAIGSSANSAS